MPNLTVAEDTNGTMDVMNVLISGTTGPAFDDIDGDTLSYRVYDEVYVTVTITGSLLTITPDPNFAGLASFSVAAYDGVGESQRAAVRVRVTPVNDAPTIDGFTPTASPVVVTEGESRTFTVTAGDIDGQPLTYTWYVNNVGQPNSNLTQFTIDVPQTEELARTIVVRVTVSDGEGGMVERSWTVDVENKNLSPTVSITTPTASAQYSTEDDITFSATGADADGDTLTFSWTSDRVGAAIGSDQTFTAKLPAGTHRIRVVVSDGTDTNEANITIVVNAPPPPPTPGFESTLLVGALAVVVVVAMAAGWRRRA
jgi:hypothetical protein